MKHILKFAVGFTIGQLMGVVNRIGMLGLLPSVAIAIIGTILACILIEAGFKQEELGDNNSNTDVSKK